MCLLLCVVMVRKKETKNVTMVTILAALETVCLTLGLNAVKMPTKCQSAPMLECPLFAVTLKSRDQKNAIMGKVLDA